MGKFTTVVPRPEWLIDPTIEPKLPVKLDAKRASERIRARLYSDSRIRPDDLIVGMVIADHVRGPANAAELKRTTIQRWAHHGQPSRVTEATDRLSEMGVLLKDRQPRFCRYTFLLDWIATWQPYAKRGKATPGSAARTPSRSPSPGLHI